MKPKTKRLQAIVFPLLLAMPLTARAATWCVTNAVELQQALTQAATSTADDEIRVRQGIYTAQQTFTYTATTSAVYLNGGWVQVGDNNCGQRNLVAAATVLEGAGQRQVLSILYVPTANPLIVPRFLVNNLSFRNGVGEGFVRGGGLSMYSAAEHYTEFFVDNVIVADNSGYFGGGASLTVMNGLIRVTNSLMTNNAAPTSAYGNASINVVRTEASTGIIVANSTFANGTCLGNTGGMRGCGVGLGLGLGTTVPVRADIVNTLFANNALSDVSIEGSTGSLAYYDYSRVPLSNGLLAPIVNHALEGDPRFVDAPNQDFRLRDDSPFINRGLAAVPLYNAAGYDLTGNVRNRFGAVDAGAYENQTWDFIFSNGFQ